MNPHRTGKVHFMWPKFVLNFKSGICAGKLNKTATLFYKEGLSNAQHISACQMSNSGLNQHCTICTQHLLLCGCRNPTNPELPVPS